MGHYIIHVRYVYHCLPTFIINISQMQVHISCMLWVIHQLHPMFALFGLAGWQDPPMRSGQHLANCLLTLSRLSLCNEQHGRPSENPIGYVVLG